MQTIKYYLISFVSFLIAFIGVIGTKLVIIAVAIGIALLTEKYIDGMGLVIGWLVGLSIGGLMFWGLQSLHPYIDKFDTQARAIKRFPYTDKYGHDYPQPKPEDFGITSHEFDSYNKRFQFGYIKLIFTYGIWISGNLYVLTQENKAAYGLGIMAGSTILAVFMGVLFNYWNISISQKHPYYHKIHAYQEACRIYRKIRSENAKI